MKEEPLTPSSDQQLEARIVALLLGEASDFERDELNRLIEQRPELAMFRNQIQSVHGLLQDVGAGESLADDADDDDWKLPVDKRSAVLAVMGGEAEQRSAKETLNKLAEKRRPAERNSFVWTLTKMAAVVCLVVLPVGLTLVALRGSYRAMQATSLALGRADSPNIEAASQDRRDRYRVQLDRSTPLIAFSADDADAASGNEKLLRSVKPSFAPKRLSNRKSESALSGIRDSLDVDGVATMPNGRKGRSVAIGLDPQGQPNADLDLSFSSGEFGKRPAFGGFDAKSTGTEGVSGPPTTALPPSDEAAQFADAEDGNGLVGSQPAEPKAVDGELSFPKFAAPSGEVNNFDTAVPDRSTINVPDDGTVLLGGVRRFAEGRSDSGAFGEPTDSPAESYFGFKSGGRSQNGVSEQGGVSDQGDRPALRGESERFGVEAVDKTERDWGLSSLGDALDAAEGKSLADTNQGITDQSGGLGSGGMGGGMGLAGSSDEIPPAGEPQAETRVWLNRESNETAPSQSAAGNADWPETPDTGIVHDARIRGGAGIVNSVQSPKKPTAAEFLKKGLVVENANEKQDRTQVGKERIRLTDDGRRQNQVNSFEWQMSQPVTGTAVVRPGSGQQAGQAQRDFSGETLFEHRERLVDHYALPMLANKSASKDKASFKTISAPAGLDERTVASDAFSTFSLHVSDVSFKLARAALAKGEWPEAAKVRIEEFVNAFDYGDPMPSQNEKVACYLEQSIHPFLQQRNLLRVSMRTAAAGRSSNTPLRLTLLLDNSGSMERIDRRQTVRRAFALLAQQLKPIDQVTLISFARQPRLLADKVSGAQSHRLVQMIDNLPSEGGTNIEAALQLAFEKAHEQRDDDAQNRIILLTDGAVNLGDADPESLSRMVTTMRKEGIAFDAAGISADGLNDQVLEALTRKGDGRYYLLDSLEAADEGFARQVAGALRPSAKNVKVQVEFNPKRVGRYKLLGFEKHRLKREDFRNDKVDAAEMAAAEAGVAIYQFEAKPDGEGDVGSVSVRFLDLSTGRMIEHRWPIPYEADAPRPGQAAPSLRIATSAALLAAKLRGEPLGESVDLRRLADLIAGLPAFDRNTPRVQQLQLMIQQARQMTGK